MLSAQLGNLHKLHPKIIDLSLGRIERLLTVLGEPQRHMPPTIHVAGTNGKGSLLAFLKAIALSAGLKPHRYISPHLVRFNERIELAGKMISDDALATALARVSAANDAAPNTFFEITTAAAFLAFAETPADLLLLETGLGGRLDATNVIEHPLLTAITPISMDHEHYLGDTIEKIAFEKAGILKPGVPCVVGPQKIEALQVIEARADMLDVPLFRFGKEWDVSATDDGFRYNSDSEMLNLPLPSLCGAHQIINAATAVACIHKIGPSLPISLEAIDNGIRSTTWPGRLQKLTQGPLVALVPDGTELWLDGGHNPGAGEALALSLLTWCDRPIKLIVGMVRNKNAAGFLYPLAPLIDQIATIEIPGEYAGKTEWSFGATDLSAIAATLDIVAAPMSDLTAAISHLAQHQKPSRILICGSLYLAGAVLAMSENLSQ